MAYTNTTHETDTLHLHPQQFSASSATTPPPPSYFRHPGVPIDPSLDSRPIHHAGSSPQLHVLNSANLQPQHLQQTYYNGMGTPPPPPAHTSPRFAHLSPRQRRQSTPAPFTPQDRQLPPRDDVSTEEVLEDAYVKFVLYCNPAYPLDVDTGKLKELFNSSPKSDGKSFSMCRLYDLIRKLEAKEIPSWIQLALDLGVEPPDTAKGQSTQKVQQWTVRLKVCFHFLSFLCFLRTSPISQFQFSHARLLNQAKSRHGLLMSVFPFERAAQRPLPTVSYPLRDPNCMFRKP